MLLSGIQEAGGNGFPLNLSSNALIGEACRNDNPDRQNLVFKVCSLIHKKIRFEVQALEQPGAGLPVEIGGDSGVS
jgi:hypothetical protein